jgi:hypothetical protein
MKREKIYWLPVFGIWAAIALVEIIHGIFRRLVMEPRMGELPARQISVVSSSLLALLITFICYDLLKIRQTISLLLVGVIWVGITLFFDFWMGLLLDTSWQRIALEFNPGQGQLSLWGVLVIALSPLIVSKLRRPRQVFSSRV